MEPLSWQICLHYILSFTHKEYGRTTSLSNLALKFSHDSSSPSLSSSPSTDSLEKFRPHPPGVNGTFATNGRRANATFVILARNSDLESAVRSVRSIEDRFNRGFQYPYVFLNEEPFTDDFKRFVHFLLDLLLILYTMTADSQFSALLKWSLG